MLFLIGLGINDEEDMPLKAINAMKKCSTVYVEFFTNNWQGSIEKIEKLSGKKIIQLSREKVESDFLIKEAKNKSIALLIPGDPLTATTHFSLMADAKKNNIEIEIIHASSIYTAVAETGLQLYKFGRTTTLPKQSSTKYPVSPLDVIKDNKKAGLHSLILLDIGMTAAEGLDVLSKNGFAKENAVVCCKLGNRGKSISYGTVASLLKKGFEVSPSVIIIPGKLHFTEEEALALWR